MYIFVCYDIGYEIQKAVLW